jgi:hypothetical protein
MAVSFTPLQPTLGIEHDDDLRLMCGCSAMETPTTLPTNSYCVDVASQGSWELGSDVLQPRTDDVYTLMLQHTFCEVVWPSTRRSRSERLCGLPPFCICIVCVLVCVRCVSVSYPETELWPGAG